MRLSKKIHFNIDGNQYYLQRDFVSWETPTSLPVLKEHYQLVKCSTVESKAGSLIPIEVEEVSNRKCFRDIFWSFKYSLRTHVLRILKHLKLSKRKYH